jgi:hypothetical protein
LTSMSIERRARRSDVQHVAMRRNQAA